MATEQSSIDSVSKKRQRRLKQDPQFIFENSVPSQTQVNVQRKPTKQLRSTTTTKTNPENSTGVDLYQPGDIVWSKLGNFPWWPALIYRCDAEGGIYTRTLSLNSKIKRQYFVYFYGQYLEYAWLSTRSLLKYAGLNDFIQNAEVAVQKASTKHEKVELANRYQLKVSMKKRVQWDEAIALADRALSMSKEQRIKQFSDLLNGTQTNKGGGRRKTSIQNIITKNPRSRSSSPSFDLPTERTSQRPTETPNDDKNEIEPPIKKKRGRKPKFDSNRSNSIIKADTGKTQLDKISSSLPSVQAANIIHSEHEFLPISKDRKPFPAPFYHPNILPLSNYEQKQIVESLINHPNQTSLTFEEGQSFAINKACEIVYENYNFPIEHIASEWFYDFLLKYPSIVFKYRSWFDRVKPDVIPDGTDFIKLKQWQMALMIEAQTKVEQSFNENERQ